MLKRIIEFSIKNKFLVLAGTAALIFGGIYALRNIPLDAIPDLSDTQVIIYTEWPGQAPQPNAHTGHGGGGMGAMLPPGHPPIDAGSISDYLLAQTARSAPGKSAGGDACGSCGMSAAEMASGQPCEHDKK